MKARDRIERSGLGVPIDPVYLDLGGTVVELISYEGTQVDPAPQTEHLGYRVIALEVDDMPKTANYLRTKGVDHRLGPKSSRDLFKGGDLRPERLPHRTQAVVPVRTASSSAEEIGERVKQQCSDEHADIGRSD